MTHHLAQLNIARARAPLADPLMVGFVEQLDRINSAADSAGGFVWRLEISDLEACALEVFGEPDLLVNLSVWTSIDTLRHYVYRGAHAGPLRDRTRWFLPMAGPSSVLWWIAAGHRPSADEGRIRLEWLTRHGPTARAFTFAEPFPPPGTYEDTGITQPTARWRPTTRRLCRPLDV